MAFRQIKTPAIASQAVTDAKLDDSIVTGQTANTVISDITSDLLLIYDASNTALKKITVENFITNSIDTDDLSEGSSNLFFTNARVDTEIDSYLSGGTGVTVSSGTIAIGQAVGTSDSVTFAGITGPLTGNVTGNLSGDVTSTGTSTFATVDINGGAIDGAVIGANSAAAGTFTTVDTTGNVTIGGNLTVTGTTTTVNSNTVEIGDNIIELNSDETGAPSQDAGIEVNRGTSDNARFIWDETNDEWAAQIFDGSSWVAADVSMASISATSFTGDLIGDVYASDGTSKILEAGTNGTDATFTGDVTGDLTGNVTGNVTGDLTGDVTGNVTGDVTGDLTGNVTGDVTGNITSSGTSTFTTVDVNGGAIDGTTIGSTTASTGAFTTITATSGYTGAVTGDVTGDVKANDGTVILDNGTNGTDATFTGDVTGDLSGNATTATTLASARNFSITGDVTAPAISFDGSGNVALSSTLANSGVTAGSYGSTTQIPVITVDGKGRVTAVSLANSGASLTIGDGAATDSVVVGTDTLTFTGGTGVTTAVTNNDVDFSIGQDVATTANVTFADIDATGTISDGTASLTSGALSGITTISMTGDLNINNNFTINATTGMATGDLTGDVTGNASTATAWETARDLSLTGDATATLVGVDGSQNVSATLTLANSGVTAGTVGSATQIPVITVDAKGRITGTSTATPSVSMAYAGDTGTDNLITSTETLTFSGGTGVESTVTANTVTYDLSDTAVTPGAYGSSSAIPTFTVDQQGRLTAAGTASIGIAMSIAGDVDTDSIAVGTDTFTIAGGTGIETDATTTDTITVTLSDQITAGSVGSTTAIPIITFNAQGQITATSTATISTELDMTDGDGNTDTVNLATDTLTFTGTADEVDVTVSDNTVTIALPDDVTIGQNLTVTGDLTVSGTTTTVNSTVVEIADPVYTIGSNASDDNKDRGVEFKYNDGSAKIGFFGYDDSAGKFTALVGATNTSEVFSGTAADAEFGAITGTSFTGDLTGDVTGDVTGDLTGNADTATALATARDLSLTGDGTATISSFDGSANVSGALTLATVNSDTGTFGSSTAVAQITVNGKGLITGVSEVTIPSSLTISDGSNTDGVTVGTDTLSFTGGTGVTTAVTDNDVELSIGQDVATTASVTFGGISVTNNVTIGGTLGSTGEATLASATVSDLTANGIVLAGTAGALEDSTNLTFDGTDFDIGVGNFTVAVSNGNTAVAGTLDVTGNVTFGGTLDVTGLASLDGGIDVDGAFTVADTSGDTAIGGTLAITGATTATGAITGNGGFIGDLTGDVTGTVSDISNHDLTDLGNVTVTSASADDGLYYNGSAWVNASRYFNVVDLADVSDSSLTGKGDYLLQVKADASGFELVDPSTVSFSTQNRVTLNGDGSSTTFNLGFTPNSGTLVFVGGIIQDPSTHYSFNAANQTVTFTDTMPTGTSAVVVSADSSAVPYVPTNGVGTGEIQNNAVTSAKLATNIDIAGTLDVTSTLTADADVSIGGNLTVTGNATIAGNLTFGDAATDTVAFSADVASDMIPDADGTRDIGATATRFANVYADNLYGSLQELSDFAHFHSSVTVVSSGEATTNASGTQAYTFSDLSTALTYQVFLNRQLLRPTEYSVSGSTLTISTGVLEENDELEVSGLKHTNA